MTGNDCAIWRISASGKMEMRLNARSITVNLALTIGYTTVVALIRIQVQLVSCNTHFIKLLAWASLRRQWVHLSRESPNRYFGKPFHSYGSIMRSIYSHLHTLDLGRIINSNAEQSTPPVKSSWNQTLIGLRPAIVWTRKARGTSMQTRVIQTRLCFC